MKVFQLRPGNRLECLLSNTPGAASVWLHFRPMAICCFPNAWCNCGWECLAELSNIRLCVRGARRADQGLGLILLRLGTGGILRMVRGDRSWPR